MLFIYSSKIWRLLDAGIQALAGCFWVMAFLRRMGWGLKNGGFLYMQRQ